MSDRLARAVGDTAVIVVQELMHGRPAAVEPGPGAPEAPEALVRTPGSPGAD